MNIVALTFLSILDNLGFSITFLLYAIVSFIAYLLLCARKKVIYLEQIELNIKKVIPTRNLGL